MKLKYNILWLDDNINTFIDDEYLQDILDYIENEGFIPLINTAKNFEEFNAQLNDSYDLIMTDYHLGEIDGDLVVQSVREKSIFTEILFYTARGNLSNLTQIDRISFHDSNTVPGEHHRLVVAKAKKLIDLTIKKFHHIVSMRGMIMNETSALDEDKIKILREFFNNPENYDAHLALETAIFGRLENSNKTNARTIKSCKNKESGLSEIIDKPAIFSAYFQNKALGDIIEYIGSDNFTEAYHEEIIKVRNQFAHSVLKNDNGREYFDHHDGEVIFDDTFCREIRKNIQKHQKYLDDLKRELGQE